MVATKSTDQDEIRSTVFHISSKRIVCVWSPRRIIWEYGDEVMIDHWKRIVFFLFFFFRSKYWDFVLICLGFFSSPVVVVVVVPLPPPPGQSNKGGRVCRQKEGKKSKISILYFLPWGRAVWSINQQHPILLPPTWPSLGDSGSFRVGLSGEGGHEKG